MKRIIHIPYFEYYKHEILHVPTLQVQKIITTRNHIHINRCVCDLCLNQPLLQLSFQLLHVTHSKNLWLHI